jgi:hypothetical protein
VVGSGAAPADVPRKHALGRPRVAVRAHYGALPSMAGRARARGGETCPAREGEESSAQWPEARLRGQKSPQIARTRGPGGAPRRRARRSQDAPHASPGVTMLKRHLGAPLPSSREEQRKETGRTSAGQNEASGALASRRRFRVNSTVRNRPFSEACACAAQMPMDILARSGESSRRPVGRAGGS